MIEEYRRKVWDSRIPLVVKINEADLRIIRNDPLLREWSSIRGRHFYRLAPRCSYLPLLFPQLQRHYDTLFTAFSNVAQQTGGESYSPWLEYDGKALAGHLPLGLLFDQCRQWDNCLLPWQLTLRFSTLPSSISSSPFLLQGGLLTMEEGSGGPLAIHYYAILKQAEHLRRGSSRKIMNLSKTEQIQLWDGLWTNSYDTFWHIFREIIGNCDDNDNPEQANSWKSIPIRFYLADRQAISKVLQGPVRATLTLAEAFAILYERPPQSNNFIIHGLEIPPETPLFWLALNLVYPDGFLHVLIGRTPV